MPCKQSKVICFVFKQKHTQNPRELPGECKTSEHVCLCFCCFVFVRKTCKQTQNKSTTKGPRELPTECETSARGGGADEATGGQEGGRLRGKEVKDFCEILHFLKILFKEIFKFFYRQYF